MLSWYSCQTVDSCVFLHFVHRLLLVTVLDFHIQVTAGFSHTGDCAGFSRTGGCAGFSRTGDCAEFSHTGDC